MSLISLPLFEIGCFVCDKKLKSNRKWYYCCTTKCQMKMASKMNEIYDQIAKETK